MTDREKVIRGLECRSRIGITNKDCEKCPYGIQLARRWGCDLVKLSCDALALLKEHDAVEPVFDAMVETDMSYWSCGACGAFIYGNAYPHMPKDNMPKYCGYCGRKVKWK